MTATIVGQTIFCLGTFTWPIPPVTRIDPSTITLEIIDPEGIATLVRSSQSGDFTQLSTGVWYTFTSVADNAIPGAYKVLWRWEYSGFVGKKVDSVTMEKDPTVVTV